MSNITINVDFLAGTSIEHAIGGAMRESYFEVASYLLEAYGK